MDGRSRSVVSFFARSARREHGDPEEDKQASTQTLAWEDDPGSGAPPIAVDAPNPSGTPLAFHFPSPQPTPRQYALGTPGFRYWVAVEALRRGANLGTRVPGGSWEVGKTLPVLLDEGEDLNAYYDRKALNFFHGQGKEGVVYSGESPDVLCHEMGHAILDAVKPGLWDAASQEVAAFHESFGDMSALLSGLQVPTLRKAVLTETTGHLYRSSRLSRLAEQLAAAIRVQHPDAVDPDCMRNAVNSFSYQDPLTLPSLRTRLPALVGAALLFARVHRCLLREPRRHARRRREEPRCSHREQLLTVSTDMRDILMSAVKAAPIVANFYSQVAAAMVSDASPRNPSYAAALKSTFVRRGILSLTSAASLPALEKSLAAKAPRARTSHPASTRVALDGSLFGLATRSLFVYSASEPRALSVTAARLGGGSHPSTSSEAAAMAFVEELFRRGKVHVGATRRIAAALPATAHPLKSHRLVKEDGDVVLRRSLFDCNFCRRR